MGRKDVDRKEPGDTRCCVKEAKDSKRLWGGGEEAAETIWGQLVAQLQTMLGLQILLSKTVSPPHTLYKPRALINRM